MPAPQRCPTNLRHWLNLTIADVPVRKLLANDNGNDNGNDAGGTGSFGAWDIHSTDCNLTKNASTGDYLDHDLQGYIDRLTNITLQLRRTKAARAYSASAYGVRYLDQPCRMLSQLRQSLNHIDQLDFAR